MIKRIYLFFLNELQCIRPSSLAWLDPSNNFDLSSRRSENVTFLFLPSLK